MNARADVIVLGAGIVGVSVALHLQKRHCQLNSVESTFLAPLYERGQLYRRAKDFCAPNRRATKAGGYTTTPA
jgi:glycine/D-amino acid oxidase-like deaminating enzyme